MMLEMIYNRMQMSIQKADHAHEMTTVKSQHDQVIAALQKELGQEIAGLKEKIVTMRLGNSLQVAELRVFPRYNVVQL